MDELEILDCVQGSPEWLKARCIPTASQFATVLAKGKSGGDSITRRKYMLTLIAQQLTGEWQESYSNAHMERGQAMEAEARNLYAMVQGVTPEPVGFLRRGNAGASPDALIGEEGVLEIKTALPHIQLERVLAGTFPAEHKAQVQGQLWISDRQWADFVSYWPALPILIVRVLRDEEYIARLAEAVAEFNAELAELKDRITRISA